MAAHEDVERKNDREDHAVVHDFTGKHTIIVMIRTGSNMLMLSTSVSASTELAGKFGGACFEFVDIFGFMLEICKHIPNAHATFHCLECEYSDDPIVRVDLQTFDLDRYIQEHGNFDIKICWRRRWCSLFTSCKEKEADSQVSVGSKAALAVIH
jgi:hypothetical protein